MRGTESYPGLGACESCGAIDPCEGCISPVFARAYKKTFTRTADSVNKLNKIITMKFIKKINSVLASITKR